MHFKGDQRARIRSILILIIIATLPCYCLGFAVLQSNGPNRQQTTQTETRTPTSIGEITETQP